MWLHCASGANGGSANAADPTSLSLIVRLGAPGRRLTSQQMSSLSESPSRVSAFRSESNNPTWRASTFPFGHVFFSFLYLLFLVDAELLLLRYLRLLLCRERTLTRSVTSTTSQLLLLLSGPRRQLEVFATFLLFEVVGVLRHPQRRLDLDLVVAQKILQTVGHSSISRLVMWCPHFEM